MPRRSTSALASDDFDLLTIGRANMDLFSRDIGAGFEDITGFDAMVGGSPTNIAIGTARLGLHSVALTAVGDDEIAKFVRSFLSKQGVNTDYIPTKTEGKTAVAILGVQPPDTFPLVFYRDNAADLLIDRTDVDNAPMDRCQAVLFSGNAFAKGPCRDASLYALEKAIELGTERFIDLDLRPDQWSTPESFGQTMRQVLPKAGVLIGTEEEFYAALGDAPSGVMSGRSVTATELAELDTKLTELLPHAEAIVLKRGPRGVTIMTNDGQTVEPAGFEVEVANTVGAGDSFASGLIKSRLEGADWFTAGRYANACGAICVTRDGCSVAMPYASEVETFIAARGGT